MARTITRARPVAPESPAAPSDDADFDFDAPQEAAPRPPQQSPRRRRRPVEEVRKEKREKFKEVIQPRAKRAIHDIRLLAYGSNHKRYYYTPEDVERLRARLHKEVDKMIENYSTPAEDIDFEP